VSQAWFQTEAGRPVPRPAKLTILRTDGKHWVPEVLMDPESNVFHKAMPWRDGILTIGGTEARLDYWTKGPDGQWSPKVLFQHSWGGQFDRLRDIEIGDVDGDGKDEIVLATHDQGAVEVGDENADGTWTFQEIDHHTDTFVHEIELGDLDGDGKLEIYATPSDRNRANLVSQPGGVVRYVYDPKTKHYDRTQLAHWDGSHAKEILVTDLGTGHDHLYASREGVTKKEGGAVKLVDPVRIIRLDPQPDGSWKQTIVATLQDQQCRFLVPGDVDHDGTVEIVAAGMKSGVYVLEPKDDGTFDPELIDGNSSGYEHATDIADLDGDGTPEIYVAADDQGKLQRYEWDGKGYARSEVAEIPPKTITFNLGHGTF